MDKHTVQGKSEKAVGHVKEAAGDLTGNKELQSEGVRDQAKGQLHETVGAAKQLGKDIKEGVAEGTHRAKHETKT
jgi:uncharacterized protein YjbJ (UPF0337 family)